MKTPRSPLSLALVMLALAGQAAAQTAYLPGNIPGGPRRGEFKQRLDEGSRLFHSAHDPEAALKILLELERDLRASPPDRVWLQSTIWKIAQIHAAAGRVERSVELYEEARELVLAGADSPWDANHFLVLGNLCWGYERLGRMGALAIRHGDAVERAQGYVEHHHGVEPNADLFASAADVLGQVKNTAFLGGVFYREAQLRFESGREAEAVAIMMKLEGFLREPFKNHWERELRARCRLRLAEWFDELGSAVERDLWEELLLVPEGRPGAGSHEWLLGRLRRAARLHAAGEDRPARRAEAEAALERLKETNKTVDWLEGRALLARMHVVEGRGNLALEVLDSAIEEIAGLQEPRVFARLLLARAELRLDLGFGLDAATEREIHAALSWFRSAGGLREEPGAYLTYARFLRLAGRQEEARQILSEASGRVRRFIAPALTGRLANEWSLVNAARSVAGARGVAAGVTEDVSDLQPLEVNTRAGRDEAAQARFAVTNPGRAPVTGSAELRGRVREAMWDEASLAWRVSVSGDAPVVVVRREIRLEPLDQARVLLEKGAGVEADAPVELTWTVADARQTAWWRFVAADAAAERKALRNDNVALVSPFYSVPLHHSLWAEALAAGARLDLRVRANASCRVEIVRADDGRVLAVDAQGDGDFLGAGDVLWEDRNRDGFPDIGPDVGGVAGIELYVFPGDGVRGLSLTTEGRAPSGEWVTQTVDQLLGE